MSSDCDDGCDVVFVYQPAPGEGVTGVRGQQMFRRDLAGVQGAYWYCVWRTGVLYDSVTGAPVEPLRLADAVAENQI